MLVYKYKGNPVEIIPNPELSPDKVEVRVISTGEVLVIYFRELDRVSIGGSLLS